MSIGQLLENGQIRTASLTTQLPVARRRWEEILSHVFLVKVMAMPIDLQIWPGQWHLECLALDIEQNETEVKTNGGAQQQRQPTAMYLFPEDAETSSWTTTCPLEWHRPFVLTSLGKSITWDYRIYNSNVDCKHHVAFTTTRQGSQIETFASVNDWHQVQHVTSADYPLRNRCLDLFVLTHMMEDKLETIFLQVDSNKRIVKADQLVLPFGLPVVQR